jgi:hypothetical protein
VVFRLLPCHIKGMIPGVNSKKTEQVLLSNENFKAMQRSRNMNDTELDSIRCHYISLFRHISKYFEILRDSQKKQMALACLKSILNDGFIPDPDFLRPELH